MSGAGFRLFLRRNRAMDDTHPKDLYRIFSMMTSKRKQFENRRRYYRVTYPYEASPRIYIYGRSYRVVNLSEGGVFCTIPDPHWAVSDPISNIRGTIIFRDEKSYHFEALVVRCPDGGMALQFKNLLPYALLVKEQLYLRRHYFDREFDREVPSLPL